MYSLEELFCPIDDFCLKFEPAWRKQLIARGKRCRDRQALTERSYDYRGCISSISL